MRIADYDVVETLTETDEKRVLLAQRGGERWILKLFAERVAAERDERLCRELGSAHVPPYQARFDSGGWTVLTQTPVAGRPLTEVLSAETTPTVQCDLALALATALADVHGRGVTYNNLALENTLIDAEGRALLFDFSWAHRRGERPFAAGRFNERQLPYLSPERTGKVKHALGAASDLYALGVILYRGLTGRFPFEAGSASELVSLHLARRPESPERVRPCTDGRAAARRD